MKPIVLKRKDARGRILGYVASISYVDSPVCKTPAEASLACEKEAIAALDRLDRGTRILKWQGYTAIVSPTIDGWDYVLTSVSDCRHQTNAPTREHAEDAALFHLAQYVWDLSVVDDEAFLASLPTAVRSDLGRWIRFQRDYARLRAEGKSDMEAYREAHS